MQDLQFDPAGNVYAVTWGHGKNLFSLKPDGTERFSRHLPEMGVNRLSVFADRLYAYTSAGARLYQLSLDNQPRSQARLNMDPGGVIACDNYGLSSIDFQYLPQQKLLLHNMGDRMRLLDEQFQTVAQWEGEEYTDKDVSDTIMRRAVHGYVLSPDQQRIAQLETSMYFTKSAYEDKTVYDTHLVIRDLQGKLLHEHKNVANGLEGRGAASPGRPKAAGSSAAYPMSTPRHVRSGALGLCSRSHDIVRRAVRHGLVLARRRAASGARRSPPGLLRHGRPRSRCRCGPLATMPTVVEQSPDSHFLAMLDEYGLVSVLKLLSDGALAAQTVQRARGGPGITVLSLIRSAQLLVGGWTAGASMPSISTASRSGKRGSVSSTSSPVRRSRSTTQLSSDYTEKSLAHQSRSAGRPRRDGPAGGQSPDQRRR